MQSIDKIQVASQMIQKRQSISKKQRIGRWTHAQSAHFQILLQKYGKNWKRIKEHMKARTLSQIRSHAQKFFEKIGPKKVDEFQRRAKLLEAYETLDRERKLLEQSQPHESQESPQRPAEVKVEQNQGEMAEESETGVNLVKVQNEAVKSSEIIKEQIKQTTVAFAEQKEFARLAHPLQMPIYHGQQGYLLWIIQQNPERFIGANFGIEPFIDDARFNSFVGN